MPRGDYQDVVDEVSALLGAPATLEDRDFTLIASSAHDGDDAGSLDPVRTRSILRRRSTADVRAWFEGFGIARAQGPVRTPADPATGVLARLCLPVRHDGLTYGYLWLLDDGAVPVTDPRVPEAMELAAHAGAMLAQDVRAAAGPARALGLLLSESPRDRAEGERALADSGHPAAGSPVTVAVTAQDPGHLPSGVVGHRAAGGLALLVPLRDPADLAPARTLALRARGARPGNRGEPAMGIGGGRSGAGEAYGSWREARQALRVATAVPGLGPVACWPDLGVHRLIASLPAAEPGAEAADPALRPLLDPAHADLRLTAETYLDHAGHAQRTAAALSVHRQTLYYRLSRIETLTGLDLDSGDDRLLLHAALKAARLAAVP